MRDYYTFDGHHYDREAARDALLGLLKNPAFGSWSNKKEGAKNLTPAEAERELSTEEKLGQMLPTIFGVNSTRGNRAWQSFKKLKQGRDAAVHLKSHDIYTRNNIDRESLFFYYYLNNDARDYPAAAIKVMSHFCKDLPRWLRQAKKLAERDSGFASATALGLARPLDPKVAAVYAQHATGAKYLQRI
jgi:hypothetical protein